MIAYGFKAQFGPQIETGATDPKTLTLRRNRKLPSKHADVGQPVGLWTGMRSKAARRRGVGMVTLRGLLRYGPKGIIFVSELRTAGDDPVTAATQREILDVENDAFARRDGFENYAALWDWHDADRDKDERGEAALVRQVIAWLPLNAEQITAIDSGARLDEVA